jgi:hypothetical protein
LTKHHSTAVPDQGAWSDFATSYLGGDVASALASPMLDPALLTLRLPLPLKSGPRAGLPLPLLLHL